MANKSTTTSAVWAKKRSASKPLGRAEIAAIKKQFGVIGRVSIIDWAQHYAVSDCGRVFSSRPTLSGVGLREITPSVDGDGYPFVIIYLDGNKRRNRRVHTLVATAFVKNLSGGRLVLHGDGNPANNQAANLRWGTAKDNVEDSRRHGTMRTGSRVAHAKAVENQIATIRLAYELGFPITAMAAELGYSPKYAVEIATGRRWKSFPSGAEILAAVDAFVSQLPRVAKERPATPAVKKLRSLPPSPIHGDDSVVRQLAC